MKIFISGITLLSLLLYSLLFQPLTKFIPNNLSEYTTFISALIGASGSIIGGILGGIITGLVAFKVVNLEFKNSNQQIEEANKARHFKLKQLVLKEISINNKALQKLDAGSNTEEIQTTLKYALSDTIYSSIKSDLEVDDFFVNAIIYYRILKRLIDDESIHDATYFLEVLKDDISELIDLEYTLDQNLNSPS